MVVAVPAHPTEVHRLPVDPAREVAFGEPSSKPDRYFLPSVTSSLTVAAVFEEKPGQEIISPLTASPSVSHSQMLKQREPMHVLDV